MEEEDLIKLAELSVATLSAEEESLLENWLENETKCPTMRQNVPPRVII